MSNPPKYSIIIPVYNREGFIERAVRSVLDQSCADLEVLCINNGSTDQTWKILEALAAEDPRVRIFNQENKGRCAARNRGLEQAQGAWICFLDSDDFYYSHHLEAFNEEMSKHGDAKALASTLVHRNHLTEKNRVNTLSDTFLNLDHFITSNPISLIQLCIHASVAKKLRFCVPDLPIAEDWLFVRELVLQVPIWKFHSPSVEVGEHNDRSMKTTDLERIARCNIHSSELFVERNALPSRVREAILSNGYLLGSHILLQARMAAPAWAALKRSVKYRGTLGRFSFYRAVLKLMLQPLLRMSPNKARK